MKKPRVPFGSIYPRGKKGTFYFENRKRGVNPTSLKTNDPDEAMERALELFGYLGHQDDRKQQERILQQFQQANTRLVHSTSSIALKDIEDEYLKVMKRIGKSKGDLHADASTELPLSPTTLRSKFGCLRHFLKWLKESFPKLACMHEVTPAIADRYFEELRGIRSASTYNNYRAYLTTIWGRLATRAGIEKNPFHAIQRLPASILSKEQYSKRPFSLKQLEKIFKKAKGTVWEPVCHLGYETGLRFGDICMLRKEQLDPEEGFLDLREFRTRKSGKCQRAGY